MIISNNFLLNIRCENIVDIIFLLSLFDGFWKMWHKFKSSNSMQYIICLWDFKGVSWVGSRIIWTKVGTHLSFMGKQIKIIYN